MVRQRPWLACARAAKPAADRRARGPLAPRARGCAVAESISSGADRRAGQEGVRMTGISGEAIGVVLGSQDATPLELWIGVHPDKLVQLDDLVVIRSKL